MQGPKKGYAEVQEMIVGRGDESSLDSVLSRTLEEALTCDCDCHRLRTYQACCLYALRFFTFVNIKD